MRISPETIGKVKILVIGDVFLDRYIKGSVSRLAPDGPYPVLRPANTENKLGGAGNVANNIVHMGAETALIGCIGEDDEGRILRALCDSLGIKFLPYTADPYRPTTLKIRYTGYIDTGLLRGYPILRVDRECTDEVKFSEQTIEIVRSIVEQYDLIVCSDYGKGFITDTLVRELVNTGKPVVIDPKPPKTLESYKYAAFMTPNRKEAGFLSGIDITDEQSAHNAASTIIDKGKLTNGVIITLDSEGLFYMDVEGNSGLISTRTCDIVDVTGAGDCIIAAASTLFGAGVSIPDISQIINMVGGIAVSRQNTAVITRDEILGLLEFGSTKIIRYTDGLKLPEADSSTIVFTNGCFDLFHSGHYNTLKYAKQQGDFLIVGIDTDASVKRSKGPTRPIIGETDRARIIAGLSFVDKVVIFDNNEELYGILRNIKPNVLVKGAQYSHDEVVGWHIVEDYGGKIIRSPMVDGVSTTEIVERIRQQRSA